MYDYYGYYSLGWLGVVIWIIALGAAVGLAFIPASMARKKGYSYGGFWVFGFFLFLPAIIVAAVIEDKTQPRYQAPYPPYQQPGQPPYQPYQQPGQPPYQPYQQPAPPPYQPPYQQPAAQAVSCPGCGAPVSGDNAYCAACGARVK